MTNNEVEHDRYDAPQKMRDDDLGIKRIWSGNIYDTLTEQDQSCMPSTVSGALDEQTDSQTDARNTKKFSKTPEHHV